MEIHTSLSPDANLDADRIDVAVVIDVLRATSVMTTAIANGAKQIVTCLTIDQARAIASQDPQNPPTSLLCGERACKKIAGFDLGNSPAEYSAERVSGKRLVLTTTNGTRAIHAAGKAREVYGVSFLNLTRTLSRIRHHGRVQIVCAGTDGFLSGEDVLLAGAMAEGLLLANPDAKLCDSTMLAMESWQYRLGAQRHLGHCHQSHWHPGHWPNQETLAMALRETRGGRNLVRLGFEADLRRCAAIDALPILVKRVSRDPSLFEQVDPVRG